VNMPSPWYWMCAAAALLISSTAAAVPFTIFSSSFSYEFR
jgi:hypothetical protein